MKESEYIVLLSVFPHFGSERIKLLISYFKSAKAVWECSSARLRKVGLSQAKAKDFSDFRNEFDKDSYFERLSKLGVRTTTFKDKDFPKRIVSLKGGPVILYYKGSLKSLDKNVVAIVGSRKMTPYGYEVTRKLAGELSSFGVTIISGLARGVDTAAHKTTLSVGGTTVAVLGNGLGSVYPSENSNLARQIVEQKGAVVSEFPLDCPPLSANFPMRNRIISGLSDATVVVEGAKKSGTLLTASRAAEQGKTVLAVPGQIFSPLSAAPHFLIANGAKMVTETKDILEELDFNREHW